MDASDFRKKMCVCYLAGMVTLVGFFVIRAIFALPNAEYYPGVRLVSATFSFFSTATGKTPQVVSIVAFVLLPVAALLF